MLVEEPKAGPQATIIDELHDRIEIVEPVFQRGAGEHQREARAQAFDHARGLGLVVLDALAFVENDQVPGHAFDRENVAEHLLVVAHGKKATVGISRLTLRRRAADKLHIAIAKAMNLGPPLALERRGTHDQHLTHTGLAGQQLGHAHALNRFSETHVVGQDRPSGAGGKCHAIELIGQERRLQERRAERMIGRIAPNGGHLVAHLLLKQSLLNKLLGVGINEHRFADLLQLRDARHEIRKFSMGRSTSGATIAAAASLSLAGTSKRSVTSPS